MARPCSIVRMARTLPNPHSDEPPVTSADFPGCKRIPIPAGEIADYEGRIEYWEASTETAMQLCEPATFYHELPVQRLATAANIVATERGAPITVAGATDLVRFYSSGRRKRLLQADQILYLEPSLVREMGAVVDVDGPLPDVVLEVDHSTDVRRRKLGLYQRWGFPELWVAVPDMGWLRPRSRPAGVTIYLLADGRYREAKASRALPGLTAREIHAALNEDVVSPETVAVMRRVGALLGAAEAKGPDDDPVLRPYRAEARAEGRLDVVASLLEARGIHADEALRERLAELDDLPPADLAAAALNATDLDDFLRRLDRRRPAGQA